MGVLSRPRLLPQERFDLEDLNALLAATRTDSKLYTKEFLSVSNYILKGFNVTGIGLKQATVIMADATLIMPQNTSDFSWFTAEPGASNVIIPEAELTPGVRNYVEVSLAIQNNTALTRAFWDPEADGGLGAEFNQIVDTITDLVAEFHVVVGGFSGNPDRARICIMDIDGSGNIKTILDRRDLFHRLGIPSNIKNNYAWGTRQEPPYSMTLTGVSGTFIAGETITINTETAKVTTGGTTSIAFNEPTGINFFPGSSVTGGTSGATGTVATIVENFTGVDKSIANRKNLDDALMSEIKLLKGTDFWWQNPGSSVSGIANSIDSVIVQAVAGASWAWDGNNLSIKDTTIGSPTDADVLAYIRIFGRAGNLSLTREDGTGGSSTIAIAEGQVLYVTLPATGGQTYSGTGAGATNFKVVNVGAYVPGDDKYWLAYRELNRLYVRGYGELESGEEVPISDPDKEEILAAIAASVSGSNQDRNMKLVRGGNWAWNSGTNTLSWSAAAAIQIPSLLETRNNIVAGSVVLTNDGDVAYVEVNRSGATPANLTVSVSAIDTLVMTNNTLIIARKLGGSGSGVLAQQLDDTAGDALDGGGASTALGNPFVVPGGGAFITNVHMHMNKVGTPSGNITISVQADSAGSPSGIPLYSTVIPTSSISTAPTIGDHVITVNATLAAGTYHLVAESDATYKASFSIFGTFVSIKRKSSGASAPYEEYFNGTVWSVGTGAALYYVINQTGVASAVVVGSHSFRLVGGESKELDAGLSIENRTLLGTGVTEATYQGVFGSNYRGIALQGFQERIGAHDNSIADFQEDRSGYLRSDVPITWTGLQLQFTQDIVLDLINTKNGVVSTHTIQLANSPIALANNESAWVLIDRTLASENLTVHKSNTLAIPVITEANKDVFVICRRKDANGAGYLHIPFHKQVLEPGQTVRLGASGSGSGSGVGDDLNSISFKVSFSDDFSKLPDVSIPVDFGVGKTDQNTYSVVSQYYRFAYDASKTVTGTGTSMTLSGTPGFTIKAGDILRVGTEARRIVTTPTQTTPTIESAFSVDPSAAACLVSQALYTKDLNAFAGDGLAPSSVFTDDVASILMFYRDSQTADDIIQDNGIVPHIAFSASADGSTYSPASTRTTNLSDQAQVFGLPVPGQNLFVRFFANKTSGTGFVNLLDYKVFFHRETAEESGGQKRYAYGRLDGLGTQINCQVGPTLVIGSKSRIRFLNDFVFPTGQENGGALKIYVNGQKGPLFVDATSTPDLSYTIIDSRTIDLDTDYSGTILTFEAELDPDVIDSSPQNRADIVSIQEVFEDKFQNIIDSDNAMLLPINGAPNVGQFRSNIIGRASIQDPSQDLLPRMGVNRIPIQNIYRLDYEQGPSGEPVYGALNDKFNQFRFVGYWFSDIGLLGQTIGCTTTDNYIEVVFYGTGLNMLSDIDSSARDYRVSVDGGAEGSNIYPSSASGSLEGQSFSANQVLSIVSGLTLGLHTVKIRTNSSVTLTLRNHGFEILNESLTISVPPGSAFANGRKFSHALLESIAYNSSFESGSLGTKGGRVITYLKPDGTVKKAVTPVDASALTLTSANHTNEEVVRVHLAREFGAGRSDDFSTVPVNSSGGARAFTLDDDTTTLTSTGAIFIPSSPDGMESLSYAANGDAHTFTFVGCGLDIYNPQSLGTDTITVELDGVVLASAVNPTTIFTGPSGVGVAKIASGLSYGTHILKITLNSSSGGVPNIGKLLIYGPKKPVLPNGALELTDYNILGNFAANSTAGLTQLSSGVIRKVSNHELIPIGTWSLSSPDVGDKVSSSALFSSTSGDSVSFTFFGTGFDLRYLAKSDRSGDITVSLNGLTLNTTNFPTASFSNYGGTTSFNSSTGSLNQNTASNTPGAGFVTSALPLAKYTLKFLNNQSAVLDVNTIDIITPIYSPKSNERMILQNVISVGSQGLLDSRKFSIHQDLPENKMIAQAIGIVGSPQTSSTVLVPIPDMSVTVNTKGGLVELFTEINTCIGAGGGTVNIYIQFVVDGVALFPKVFFVDNMGVQYPKMQTIRKIVNLCAGFHKIDVYYLTTGGSPTAMAYSTDRLLEVKEL